MVKRIVFAFGRYNPPTTGHAELINYTVNLAHKTGADHRIYTSQSQDASKNPLSARQKLTFLRQIFPGVNFVDDPSAKSAFIIAKKLADEGYEDVTFVVGADRVDEFRSSMSKYVKPKTAKGYNPKIHYPFKKFQVVSSGARKKGISGTDLRAAVRKGDFATFAKASAAKDKTLVRQIYRTTKKQLHEDTSTGVSRKDFHEKLKTFVDYTCQKLGIDEPPSLHYKDDKGEGQPSFGGYSPSDKKLMIYTKNRHPMDIFRTVAHELVHHKQNLDGRLGKDIAKEGATGSNIENEANSEAGKVMRYFGAENPFYFDMEYVKEHKAIILAGVPGSGKDKILKEAILPFGFVETSAESINKKTPEGNIVVTGATAYNQIATLKEALELRGYDTIMVFVNTSDAVSKQRNESRADKGGRVITETVRFAKWKSAQENLSMFDSLFETVIEVKNDLDLNQPDDVIHETYTQLIEAVSRDIEQFAKADPDKKFENMLNEVGGAGNWGTPKLTRQYQKDTPGQTIGFRPMKVLRLKNRKMKKETVDPIRADRIGTEYGFPKNPTMGAPYDDNQSIGTTSDPISRWMVKEETKRLFKKKYGELAEKKIREIAAKLKNESLIDPYTGGMSDVAVTGLPASQPQDERPSVAADFEKTSLFGKRKKQLNRNVKK